MTFFTVLFYIFVASAVIQILYYLFFLSFINHKNSDKKKNNLPISVIICAKNEEDNLKKLLPKLLSQDYSTFQIVLINDASTDKTLEVMKSFKQNDARVKIVHVKNNNVHELF